MSSNRIIDLSDHRAVTVIQRGLGVAADGVWGPITQRAWDDAIGGLSQPDLFGVPGDWLPVARMSRIIVHWTGGAGRAGTTDRRHYHILVEQDGSLVRGDHSIIANERLGGKAPSEYAAHTSRCNTGSIGLGLCGMAGAIERPFDPGPYPLTERQWDRSCEVIAALCQRYVIPVSSSTALTHAEVEPNLGIRQSGKWDIIALPWREQIGAKPIGNYMREQVLAYLARMP